MKKLLFCRCHYIAKLQVQIVFIQNYLKDFRKKGQFQAHLVQYWKFVLFLKNQILRYFIL